MTCAGLIAEINNGRLAMLGIMGFIAEAKIPGAVPALQGLIPAYKGEVLRAAQMIIRLFFRENFFFTAFLACKKRYARSVASHRIFGGCCGFLVISVHQRTRKSGIDTRMRKLSVLTGLRRGASESPGGILSRMRKLPVPCGQ